jgi:hypothetical protein
MAQVKTTRFSGADWADQLHPIMLIGVGGIGSWLALNLSRIGHQLFLVDPDTVDETNVTGGQMYKQSQVGQKKVHAVQQLCRELGATAEITAVDQLYTEEDGATDICITGLDNMAARKLVYETWKKHVQSKETDEEKAKCLLLDGRLTLEMFEVLCIQGNRPDQMEHYEREYLFDDAETVELDCTTKQSTFGAMGISCLMTATLCNWLTNQKLEVDFREVPFYQRHFFPIFGYARIEPGQPAQASPIEVTAVIEEIAAEVLPGNSHPEAVATIEAHPEPKEASESVNRLKSLFT